ncbi:MAG: type II CAAX prenyl endopeptidase Rce1 family protein [Flavobacteriia bacterium]|jgi:membrane protease YdiL (CAAX protease family)
MSEHSFFGQRKSLRSEFIHSLLTLLICALVLILSANIAPIYYSTKTGNTSFTLDELSLFFGKNLFFLSQLIPFALTLLSLVLCFKFIHKESISSLFSARKKFDFKRFSISFLVWFSIMSIFLLLNLYQSDNQIQWNFSSKFWPLLVISLVFVTLQTTFEEVLFRSYLMKKFFHGTKSKLISLLLSSILFGLMHINNPEIDLIGKYILIYFIGTGLFLGLLTIFDNGIELSMGFHAANNIFASIILTNNWQVFQTDALLKDFSPPIVGWDVWINLLIIFPALLFLYAKIYKWNFGVIIAKFTKKIKNE